MVTNKSLTIAAILQSTGGETSTSVSKQAIIDKVREIASELREPRGPRCNFYVRSTICELEARRMIEKDPDSLEDDDIYYRLTDRGCNRFRKALDKHPGPLHHAPVRLRKRFMDNIRSTVLIHPNEYISHLEAKLARYTSDDSDSGSETSMEEVEKTIDVQQYIEPEIPLGSTSLLEQSSFVSYTQLPSPPISTSGNTSIFSETPESRRTPIAQPRSHRPMPGRLDDDDDDDDDSMDGDLGVGDDTLIEPDLDMNALDEKLRQVQETCADVRMQHLEGVNQGIGDTTQAESSGAAIRADNHPPKTSYLRLAFSLAAKCTVERRALEAKVTELSACQQVLKSDQTTIEVQGRDASLFEKKIADCSSLLVHEQRQRKSEKDDYEEKLARQRQLCVEAVAREGVIRAELKVKDGIIETLQKTARKLKSHFDESFAFQAQIKASVESLHIPGGL